MENINKPIIEISKKKCNISTLTDLTNNLLHLILL